ncbi:hypothetical protein RRG08_024501 [Elysia crispata]|uniref:Uncharacterized protein n=1 Tax=Elysia crispata TaxID=231223 RepID=A0AAE1D242_9GAST|nr:hypothetical protein RRG08_024501 [Elysia crispata]
MIRNQDMPDLPGARERVYPNNEGSTLFYFHTDYKDILATKSCHRSKYDCRERSMLVDNKLCGDGVLQGPVLAQASSTGCASW